MRVSPLYACLRLLVLCLVLGACSNGDPSPAPPPPPPPAAATAVFSAPATATTDVPVVFDAGASTSSDGSDLRYLWDFGDGQRGSGRQIARLFATGGARTVTLTVIDGAGLTDSESKTVTVAAPSPASGTASVEGDISDVDGVALDGVTVAVVGGSASGVTSATGKVRLTLDLGVSVVLKLTRSGYADQFVALQMPGTAGTDAYFAATMRTRDAPLALADAAAGGTVTGRDGAILTLPANALVTAAGSAVTGAVSIAMTPVDVTQAAADGFPGRFDGLPATGIITPIVSFGTVEYVLTAGAERLQLAPGKTAIIEIPLYATVNADGSAVAAGGTTPLWSLDESTGLWVQEGLGDIVASAASPTGLALRASVTHFSWWNADIGFDPYGPEPKCVYDTDSGIPGGNDTFATATICNLLAEFDRDPTPAPLSAARAQRTAAALSPRIVGYSRRAVLPIAGGITIPVPANVDIALSASALNGTWTGRRIVNGAVGVRAEERILMRPIEGSGPAMETIATPFDATRALQTDQTARYRFAGTAFRYARVTVSQGSQSLLTGRVRLLQGSTLLGTADFAGSAGRITAQMPVDGDYVIEVTGLTNTPGAYRLQLELLGSVQTEALTVPFSIDRNLPAFSTYRSPFTTTPLSVLFAYASSSSNAAGLSVLAPDGSVLLNLPASGNQPTQTRSVTLPSDGTYTVVAASTDGQGFNLRASAERTQWVGDAPPLPTDGVFALIDLVPDRNGRPVVVYTTSFDNAGHTSRLLKLRRWTGTAWEAVGTDLTIDSPCTNGLSAIGAAFDPANAPIIAYGNASLVQGDSSTYVSARRYTAGAWQPLGPNDGKLPNGSTFGGACNSPPAIAFNAAGALHLAYRVDGNVVVQRFDGSLWTDVTTSGADTFAAPGYSFDLRADANGRIYFVLASGSFSGVPTRVRRLTTAATPAWENVGPNNGALPEIGTLGLGNGPPRLRFDGANSPLIAFIACVGTGGVCASGIAVYRYDGTQWSTTGGYQPASGSYISNGNDLGFTLLDGETYVSWVNTISGVSAPLVQKSTGAGYLPVGADLGQVPQFWAHGLIASTGYSTRLLATGGELYLAAAVSDATKIQIQLLRKVD